MKRIGLVLLVFVVACAGNYLFFKVGRDVNRSVDLANVVPEELGECSSESLTLKDYVYKILGTRNVLARRYTCPGGSVYLTVIVSESDRRVVHPPEVCLKGGGEKVLGKRKVVVNGHRINQLTVRDRAGDQLVWYWYALGSEYLDNYYLYQLKYLYYALTGHPKRTYLIRLVLSPREVSAGEELIRAFDASVRERL